MDAGRSSPIARPDTASIDNAHCDGWSSPIGRPDLAAVSTMSYSRQRPGPVGSRRHERRREDYRTAGRRAEALPLLLLPLLHRARVLVKVHRRGAQRERATLSTQREVEDRRADSRTCDGLLHVAHLRVGSRGGGRGPMESEGGAPWRGDCAGPRRGDAGCRPLAPRHAPSQHGAARRR